MVLRSGVIIPFQFRDNKKLLTVGVPEENRELSIWDVRHVVRSAFGIYNFEFRNKKIGFNIPDELLLNYLAQRHDLTNFVIEIVQAIEQSVKDYNGEQGTDIISYEPSCSTQLPKVSLSLESNESSGSDFAKHQIVQIFKSPPDEGSTTNGGSPLQGLISYDPFQTYVEPETLMQSIDPMDIMPKLEQDEIDFEIEDDSNGESSQQFQHQPQYFVSSAPNILLNTTPGNLIRSRRRVGRMCKEQKEIYVDFFEENLCMLTQKRNETMLQPLWCKLCNMLNNVPQGAVKNIEEWKQTFDAWRYRVYMYMRINSKLVGKAARNPRNYKPLTLTDLRAYDIWTSNKNSSSHDFLEMGMFVDGPNSDFVCFELSTGCISCRCVPLQNSKDDANATPANPQNHQLRFRHSSRSNHDSPTSEPEYKMRRQEQNSNEPPAFTSPMNTEEAETLLVAMRETTEEEEEEKLSHVHPKIEYECNEVEEEAVVATGTGTGTATATSATPTVVYHSDAPSPETHFDRLQMHHEYYLQQQQQYHQQQQQLQQHMEVLIQERTPGGLRQRKERMSRKQKEMYVTYLEQTPIMSEYKRNDPVLDTYWQKLTDILNSVPQGAAKSVSEWKQAFDNWRFRIFLYARYNSKLSGDAAVNHKNFKPLTLTDKRAYSLWIRNPDTAPPDLDKMRNIFVNIDETQPE